MAGVRVRSGRAASGSAPRTAPPAWLPWCAGSVLAAAALFFLYLRQAQTWRVDADAAAIALQAQDMAHGNVLLHGWWVADLSFYTTELPEYVGVGAVRGFSPELVHLCAALTYTMLVLLAALLAKGRARGREGIAAALLTAAMMLSPGTFRGTNALLGMPDHTGTGVPVLLILLLLDRAEGAPGWKRRWPVAVAACLLLTWVQIADSLATYAAAVPLALVGVARAGAAMRRRDAPRQEWRYDLALTAAAAASVPLAYGTVKVIHAHGGFYVNPVSGSLLGTLASIPSHALAVGESVLVLFGADFFGQPTGIGAALAWLHLAVVAVAAVALLAGIRGFSGRLDRVGQVLVAGTVILLAAGVFSTHLPNVSYAHEIAIVLPFGAVLAGRLLGGPLVRARLEPVLAAGLAVYLGALCYTATSVAQPPQNQAAADWLVAHHFSYGLASYWQADSITFDSNERVRVAPLRPGTTEVYRWESDAAWYDPRSHYANFVITEGPAAYVVQRFGKPAQVYHYQHYVIMVWHKNLLPLVRGDAELTGTQSAAGSSPTPG